jgi:hypothetical protein
MRQVLRGVWAGCAVVLMMAGVAAGQDQPTEHGRKYKPIPPMAHIVVTVQKGFNGKPLQNAAVVFHAVRNGVNDGNLEVKTDPDGKATIDVIEIGSQVTVQVIAYGFATYASDLNVDGPSKELLVKLQRPQAQVSDYQNNDGKPAEVKPGVQEHVAPKPVPPPTATPATPAPQTTPATSPNGPPQ